MAGCVISTGRGEACKDSLGGISAVYIFNYGEATFTVNADGWVTDIQPTSGTGTVNAYKYVTRHQSNMDQTIQASAENGTVFFDQAVNLVLKRLDAQTSKEVKLLAWGRPQIVVETNTGQAWLCGYAHGCDVVGGTISTGTAKGDLAGYTINFLGQEKEPAFEVSGAVTGNPFAKFPEVNLVSGVAGGVPAAGAYTSVDDEGTNTIGDPLDSSNQLKLIINVTTVGAYSFSTDMVQGISYTGSGDINSIGAHTIYLQGYGTPEAPAGDVTLTVTSNLGTFTAATGTNVASVTIA